MIAKFSRRIFERQRTLFPDLVQKLETLRDMPDPRKTTILTVAALVAHDLRNQLTVIGVVLELEETKKPDTPEYGVLPS